MPTLAAPVSVYLEPGSPAAIVLDAQDQRALILTLTEHTKRGVTVTLSDTTFHPLSQYLSRFLRPSLN